MLLSLYHAVLICAQQAIDKPFEHHVPELCRDAMQHFAVERIAAFAIAVLSCELYGLDQHLYVYILTCSTSTPS